jgi:hypothetical protein
MMAIDPELIDQLWQIHNSDARRQALLMNAYGFDSTRSWVSPDGYRLSDRIWRARRAVRDDIDRVLREALANGTDALEVAKILEQYLDPSLAPIRDVFGRLIRNQKKGAVTRAPGRSGAGSYASRRLARTEISRAFAQATLHAAEANPFVDFVRYATSARHPAPDECTDAANRDTGHGRGVYEIADAPVPPLHPQCLCRLEPVVTDDVDQVVSDLKERYGLQ